ncbi:GNAT family N-acetyltransferase [Actinobacteria bacterium YIM 96077]|uniref:GNAT family N-acetyltransferase n=1 Tax=Phytoactinopolyspora halophila TaxID=1981511 RepID=A0A329QFN6_9ACTN|nr:GNAT family N-acetyltransferase [Actinobacteria bacterium YIM 96077]RAW11273.1 GNAT family N-acetyltransferase [Phytoactinopolyspora halophila]
MRIRALRYSDPVVRALEDELQQEYVARYGGDDDAPISPEEFEPPHGEFLVGFLGNEPVASGGFRRYDTGIAEIKRMYVSHEHRGGGHARRLLAELEARAVSAGYRRLVLETGTKQPEAIALYTSSGYSDTEPFGYHAHSHSSRYFGKDLDLASRTAAQS